MVYPVNTDNTEEPSSSSDNVECQDPADVQASESEDSGSHLLLASESITDLHEEEDEKGEEKLVKDEGNYFSVFFINLSHSSGYRHSS